MIEPHTVGAYVVYTCQKTRVERSGIDTELNSNTLNPGC